MAEGDRGLETLQVWQKAMSLAKDVYENALPALPAEEKWALKEQLRRSVQSVPANIAEGYGRFYYQESIRFCYIARGSREETFSHLTLAQQIGYLSSETHRKLAQEIDELRRMLNGYINFLKQSKRGANEPGATLSARDEPAPYLPDSDPEAPDS